MRSRRCSYFSVGPRSLFSFLLQRRNGLVKVRDEQIAPVAIGIQKRAHLYSRIVRKVLAKTRVFVEPGRGAYIFVPQRSCQPEGLPQQCQKHLLCLGLAQQILPHTSRLSGNDLP